jgi:hypothetical protein
VLAEVDAEIRAIAVGKQGAFVQPEFDRILATAANAGENGQGAAFHDADGTRPVIVGAALADALVEFVRCGVGKPAH